MKHRCICCEVGVVLDCNVDLSFPDYKFEMKDYGLLQVLQDICRFSVNY